MAHSAAHSDRVNLARMLAPVTTLGPGRRLGLWVQGCTLACPGCASRDTWDPAGGRSVTVADLAYRMERMLAEHRLDGITITGGEPTDQAAALTEVLSRLAPRPDVLVFTGRTHAAATAIASDFLALAACVVAGPYRADQPPVPALRRLVASGNQTVHYAGPEAEERYMNWLSREAPDLQLMADDRDLYLVGLPGPGDLDRFRASLAARGVLLGGATWTA